MPDILNLLDILIDDRVGIIHEVRERRKNGAASDLVYMSAATSNLKMLNPDQHLSFFMGSGTATDRPKALAKAVGEAVERYCAAMYRIEDFPLSAFESAAFPCIQPEAFSLFSRQQYAEPGFPYRPFLRKTRVRWTPAFDLCSRTTQYVPAAMVFLPYDQKATGETAIIPQISSGVACHSDPWIAACSAISEVVERDAIAITWQAKLAHSQINQDSLSQRNQKILSKLRRPGATIILLHLSMDHQIPVIFSLMISKIPDAPALVVSAAAHLDPEQAVQKSLEELAQISSLSQHLKSECPKFSPGKQWENVIDPHSHAALYFDQSNLHLAAFLWGSRNQIALEDITNLSTQNASHDLRFLVENVNALGHRVLLVDITSEDIRSFGLWVFRALIPGFHPLMMGYRFRILGGERLWTIPQMLGHPGLVPEKGDNPAPHPFA